MAVNKKMLIFALVERCLAAALIGRLLPINGQSGKRGSLTASPGTGN